jgi:hypothetical protein
MLVDCVLVSSVISFVGTVEVATSRLYSRLEEVAISVLD